MRQEQDKFAGRDIVFRQQEFLARQQDLPSVPLEKVAKPCTAAIPNLPQHQAISEFPHFSPAVRSTMPFGHASARLTHTPTQGKDLLRYVEAH